MDTKIPFFIADTVSHSTAFACGRFGIYGAAISDCKGEEFKNSGYGINAFTANNCTGYSNGTSYGSNGDGLSANAANNCTGNNYGNNGVALAASVANNCFGNDFSGSLNGIALNSGVAIGCFADSTSGIGISANIANSCMIIGGATNIVHKYNMP